MPCWQTKLPISHVQQSPSSGYPPTPANSPQLYGILYGITWCGTTPCLIHALSWLCPIPCIIKTHYFSHLFKKYLKYPSRCFESLYICIREFTKEWKMYIFYQVFFCTVKYQDCFSYSKLILEEGQGSTQAV